MTIPGGTVHRLNTQLRSALVAHEDALVTWRDTTPLARNEWICLATSAKNEATTVRRLERIISQLSRGQRRPCCWQSCPHREKNN